MNPSYFDVNYRGTIGFDPSPNGLCQEMMSLSQHSQALEAPPAPEASVEGSGQWVKPRYFYVFLCDV